MYRNLFSCKDKVALVTGGLGLIGKEIVRGLNDFGASVCVADIDERQMKGLENLAAVNFQHLDITSENSIGQTLEAVIDQFTKIDILVNCAYPRTGDWGARCEDVIFDSWKMNLNSHLGGYFLCCQKTAEQMKLQGGGSIINFASIYGVVAPDFSIYEGTPMTMPVAYSAIKGGVIAFSKYMSSYYAKDNIRVNCVSSGGVFDSQPEGFVEKYTAKTPLGRMGTPKDMVGAVLYLASDASLYVTGHNLVVDGGWTAC
ncbi:MAG: short-chain dehydrogenase [Syntrophus sp. (in: bacteria)]|nr:short-chain dehydrogenase [Syntrophus sp. (in: bacteria)]